MIPSFVIKLNRATPGKRGNRRSAVPLLDLSGLPTNQELRH